MRILHGAVYVSQILTKKTPLAILWKLFDIRFRFFHSMPLLCDLLAIPSTGRISSHEKGQLKFANAKTLTAEV